ncbi:mtDNA inheritance, partitioning of the mitochondrial organelle [Mortierella polycephala]|uniref:MtDNA inheritance, partitioning of the mitochondrial organelle n=1 Tax=Mortierella polycephala TaxID=41804 RepID=A0A9P6U912_9FUNG|nr:mtDNA inheritance, partitioning of the mitochondrial organelle [Mortierella polycephala]
MHEIVTLQFGHYANHVGTHFWNTQEAHFNYQQPGDDEEPAPELVNHDRIYRVGMTTRGIDTFTPRALIYDLKGGFGSIKKHQLYESNETQDSYQQQYDQTWDPSKMETFQEEEYARSAYQQHLQDEEMGASLASEAGEDDVELNEVRTWSDFNRVYFHPKSMVTISGYQMDSEFMPFDVFSYGRTAFLETEKEKESYDENFRLFTEECDQLQGFQVMADVLDGWGGYASSFLEQLREDFPKTAVLTYGFGDDMMGRHSTLDDQVYSQSVVLRGLETNQFARYAAGTQKTPREVVDEMLDSLPIGKSLGDSKLHTPLKYPIPTSFPRFFQGLTPEGYQTSDTLAPNLREDGTSKVQSVPAISRLAVSSTTRWQLNSLSESVKRIDWRLLPQFDGDGPGGVTNEEFTEAKEALLDMYDIYNE